MTQPIAFDAASARHAFPFLVAGQAQKEFFVNEALARIDALLHPVIEGEIAGPPASPEAGQCWLVAQAPSGDWAGREGQLAAWDAEQWTYCAPVAGMEVFDVSTGQRLLFKGSWQRASRPAEPNGGTVVDVEARAAISELLDLFATLAIIPTD